MCQIAEEIRHMIDAYTKPVPSVLEIPSKDMPYDASKDTVLKRAQVGLWPAPRSRHSRLARVTLTTGRGSARGVPNCCRVSAENVHERVNKTRARHAVLFSFFFQRHGT